MLGLGPGELILILILVLFFCGGKRLPLIGEGLGKGITEFKRAIRSLAPGEKADDGKSARTEGKDR
jgi:sec-independent protein translocase protein TatA